MKFSREKRLRLGWLALLAPLPLPFNDALEWWALLLYTLFVVHFLHRVERDTHVPLATWALNALGLIYLPVLVLDLRRGVLGSSFLEPLLHLLLFLLVVKLYALRKEGEKWHAMVAIFFVFAGAMATSSHLSIAVFLIAFVILALSVLLRFAHLHTVVTAGQSPLPGTGVPLRAPVAVGTLAVMLLTVPLFAFLPRFRDPFVFGQGDGDGSRMAGFSDAVDLSQTSAIRGNRAVVMRLTFDGPLPRELRFKGATYDRYVAQRWIRLPELARGIASDRRGRISLAPGEPRGEVEVFLEPLRSPSLVLPLESLAVSGLAVPGLMRDPGGAHSLPLVPREALRYRVELADEPVIVAAALGDRQRSALDLSGVTPSIRGLAREVMGEGPDGERIDRLERHLLRNYRYTLDHLGQRSGNPLEDFLFVNRRGHCELFATSMVLMLRSEGVPARLVAGYLEAEYNPLQGYYIVRQDNAHAWVEAWDETRGWRVYDPTPPEGRPSAADWSPGMALTQLYDYLIFRWDRYVLSFAADDQAGFFEKGRDLVAAVWQRLLGLWPQDEPAPATPADDAVAIAQPPLPRVVRPGFWLLVLPPILAVVATLIIRWRHRRPATAELAYRHLRRLLARAGCEIGDALAPRALERLAAVRYPAAAPAVGRLIGLYLEESFGERVLRRRERRVLGESLSAVGQALRGGRRGRPTTRMGGATPAA